MLFEKIPYVVVEPAHNAEVNASFYHLLARISFKILVSVVFNNFQDLLLEIVSAKWDVFIDHTVAKFTKEVYHRLGR
jgi:hypothetical protein